MNTSTTPKSKTTAQARIDAGEPLTIQLLIQHLEELRTIDPKMFATLSARYKNYIPKPK
jgi:hypothetical protein